MLSTLLKVVEMGNVVSHPKDKTLSFADRHNNAAWLPIIYCLVAGMEPDIPWIEVDVGVRELELVPSSQDSSLKIWRLETTTGSGRYVGK